MPHEHLLSPFESFDGSKEMPILVGLVHAGQTVCGPEAAILTGGVVKGTRRDGRVVLREVISLDDAATLRRAVRRSRGR